MRSALTATLLLAAIFAAPYDGRDVALAARVVRVQKQALSRTELPTPGVFASQSGDSKAQYYLAPRKSVCDDSTDLGKLPGLYASTDGGSTWRNVRADLAFREVFVHPETGWIFAVIEVERYRTDFDTDHLERGLRFRLIRSANGRDWSDISGANTDFPAAYHLFADPDHSGRVCFRTETLRPYVAQSEDAAYSKWRLLHVSEWRRRHPQSGHGIDVRQPN